MQGVWRTRVGYCGGTTSDPTYRSIGDHTEAISIDYDPGVLSYETLLDRFWTQHRCQSNAHSRQYLHAVFSRSASQEAAAQQSLLAHAAKLDIAPEAVATRILPIDRFTLAERYHQKYRIRGRGEVRRFLEETYPEVKSFADSTVAMRINAVIGSGTDRDWGKLLDELAQYGLPQNVETQVRGMAMGRG
ncbi:MAG: methionine-S-sulfoxide reductase [Limisphaerales bacterium]|jgi:methionine-S-sulfoxide reductase